MGRFRAKIQFSSAVVAHATFARREICEKDVHSHTNYGSCLAPNRIGKWDVFFLWRTLQIRISLHRAWVARKSTFLLKMLDLNNSYRYPEGPRAHLRVLMFFSGPAPPTWRRSDEVKCVVFALENLIRPSRHGCALNFALNRSRAGSGPDR